MSKYKDNAPAERPPGSQPIGMSRAQNLVALPEITVRNLQRTVQIDVAALEEFAHLALQLCFRIPRNEPTQLKRLRKIFVLLISNRRMARLHRQFLGKVGPTDVLTFEHGEIFVSAEMARDQARSFGSSLGQELRRSEEPTSELQSHLNLLC